jgi:hypothetical protein
MRSPKLSGRIVAVVALTAAPSVFVLGSILGMRAYFGGATRQRSLSLLEMSLIYIGFLISLQLGLRFRRPPIDPVSRWGIFAKRERTRPRLWMFMVKLALCAPVLALLTQGMREHTREFEVLKAEQRANQADSAFMLTELERNGRARAREHEQKATECRAKHARDDKFEGARYWADRAQEHENNAAWWREQASWASNIRKRMEATIR